MKHLYYPIDQRTRTLFSRVPRTAKAIVSVTLFLAVVLVVARPFERPERALSATLVVEQPATSAAEPTVRAQQFAARVGINHQAIDLDRRVIDTRKLQPLPVHQLKGVDEETLWLARGIYSETKRPEEMELVAWAIRNRVETGYRGKRTYKDTVLDPWQFSAFNSNSPKRSYFTSLRPEMAASKWREALTIARVVKEAPAELRPFSETTRHYYSERSMVGRRQPAWAAGQQPITPNRPFQLEAQRFRFYENIA